MKNISLDYYYYFLYNCKNYILEQHVQIVQKLFHGWIVFPRIDLWHLIKSRFKLSCLRNLKKEKSSNQTQAESNKCISSNRLKHFGLWYLLYNVIYTYSLAMRTKASLLSPETVTVSWGKAERHSCCRWGQ